ncbi:MFS transporter [Aminivibrio sp.]|uniref:MFS transporter n=1 Tax=Aminivibrio sp. TaxID=1872489 RepID=UPI001A414B9A|nr:MFS transporter [Aminivibrio sp.]MBL3540085.1 MFS transporter [Aminivibrio sp.]MDK2959700.1 transporter, family, fosmidomycin resistance protein [Synergistaceae bacterium]
MTSKTFRLFHTESSGFKLSMLSVGHFFNDLYASFLPTFIPTLISRLGITMAQAGFFSTLLGVIHIVFQPVIGYLSDRSANPWLIIWGPILTCFGATMIPLSPTYGAALFFVGLWGLGSAMFHPQGHGGVGHVVPRDRLTVSLALFAVAGTAGVTMSPLFAVALVNTVGLKLMPVAAILPVLILGLFTWRTMPSISHESGDAMMPQKGLLSTMKSVFAVIYPIWAMSTVRDATSQGVRMFFPIRIAAEGGDIAFVGTVLFLIMLGSTITMLVIGRMADRYGKKKTLTVTMALSSLFLFTGRVSGGWTAILFFVLGTAAVNATMPITAAIAQEMVPNSRGMASSIVMGLSWGMGNMLMAPFGRVGDLYGVNATLFIVALLPLISLPLLFTRPFREAKD